MALETIAAIFAPLVKLATAIWEWFSKDRRKVLPYTDVSIGTYATDKLKVDIGAQILLSETVTPPVDEFLKRLRLGNPYCANCSRPLDLWRASWMADYLQIGYKCPDCKTEIKKDWDVLSKEVAAEVRRSYDSFWLKYNDGIMAVTKAKPHKYRLP